MKNKTTAILALFVFVAILVGCGGSKVTRENYDKIQRGMTTQQVIEIMGKPKSIDDTEEFVLWHYYSGDRNIFVFFENGKVSDKSWETD